MPIGQMLKNAGFCRNQKRNRQFSDIIDGFSVSFLTVLLSVVWDENAQSSIYDFTISGCNLTVYEHVINTF